MFIKKKYSLYQCESSEEDSNEKKRKEVDENDVNYSGNSYDDYYYDDYEWREARILVRALIIIMLKSQLIFWQQILGVIAKRGENKSYLFACK
nr:hypothetical protein [Flavobacterium sp. MDT1-60]